MFCKLVAGLLTTAALVANVAPAVAGEKKALEVKKTFKTGLFGFSEDDVYDVPGKVVRVELEVTVNGKISGNASEVTPRVAGVVRIHRYLDLFSEMTYTLRVYVEDK